MIYYSITYSKVQITPHVAIYQKYHVILTTLPERSRDRSRNRHRDTTPSTKPSQLPSGWYSKHISSTPHRASGPENSAKIDTQTYQRTAAAKRLYRCWWQPLLLGLTDMSSCRSLQESQSAHTVRSFDSHRKVLRRLIGWWLTSPKPRTADTV